MFDFGDELVLRSYRVPWLMWVQILVMFLLTLIIFLYYFEFFEIEPDSSSPTSGFLSPASSPRLGDSPTNSERSQGSVPKERQQVAGNHDGSVKLATDTSSRTRRTENNSDTDDSSPEDLTPTTISDSFCHPCRYFDFAKEAFLKCLGLGSSSQGSPPRQQRHED